MRVSEQGKTVYLEVGVWYNEDQGHIHVATRDGDGFHTTVSPDPKSVRGNPNFFWKLAECLRKAGVSAPETEPTKSS